MENVNESAKVDCNVFIWICTSKTAEWILRKKAINKRASAHVYQNSRSHWNG